MINPTAVIHSTAVLGEPPEHRDWGIPPNDLRFEPQIRARARINAFVTVDAGLRGHTVIGERAFLMAHVHVGHDAYIGADCELAPGTVIAGHAVLEDGVRCGIGVLVKPFVRVGKGARLGAGAVVVKDVPAGEVWVGNPARRLEKTPDEAAEWWQARAAEVPERSPLATRLVEETA